MWMRADNDFKAAYEGKDKLRLLPYNLRNEAALVMHREVSPALQLTLSLPSTLTLPFTRTRTPRDHPHPSSITLILTLANHQPP